MLGIIIVLVLMVMGGLIAFLGDKIGSKVGKKRLTLFGLRPKYTSIIVTIISGTLISFFTVAVMAVVNENIRVALFGLNKLKGEMNELNREIATALLEEIGIIVDSVEDGTDAVERMNEVEDDRYDLIFMDIQMPKMNGYMTTREIRTLKNNKKANIPIVAMTANAFEEDKKKAFKAGMNAHVAKPIDIKTILAVFDQVFGRI